MSHRGTSFGPLVCGANNACRHKRLRRVRANEERSSKASPRTKTPRKDLQYPPEYVKVGAHQLSQSYLQPCGD
jgi:hypothetical protein